MLFNTRIFLKKIGAINNQYIVKSISFVVKVKHAPVNLKSIFTWTSIAVFSCLVLTGCGGDKRTKSTEKFINEVKNRPQKKIEALPEIKPTKTVKYTSQNLRSPFKPEQKATPSSGLSPDVSRSKEELEAYPLDSLRMVGTITQNKREWALILASNKYIYKVTIGSHIGQNYGRIVSISKDKVEIIETVPDGLGDWKERDAYLSLVE